MYLEKRLVSKGWSLLVSVADYVTHHICCPLRGVSELIVRSHFGHKRFLEGTDKSPQQCVVDTDGLP